MANSRFIALPAQELSALLCASNARLPSRCAASCSFIAGDLCRVIAKREGGLL